MVRPCAATISRTADDDDDANEDVEVDDDEDDEEAKRYDGAGDATVAAV